MSLSTGVEKRFKTWIIIALILIVVAASALTIYYLDGEDEGDFKQVLMEISSKLDLLIIEYNQSVENGEVINQAEYYASIQIVDSLINKVEENRDVIPSNVANKLITMLNDLKMAVENREARESVAEKAVLIKEYIEELVKQ